MDTKAIEGGMRAGRRTALAGLLTGAMALLSEPRNGQARKRCRRHSCPQRTCCQCPDPSPTPGCRLGPIATGDLGEACDQVCGGFGTWSAASASTPGSVTLGCSITDECVQLRCPI
jgi:hypothetical protein